MFMSSLFNVFGTFVDEDHDKPLTLNCSRNFTKTCLIGYYFDVLLLLLNVIYL